MIQKKSTLEEMLEFAQWELLQIDLAIKIGRTEYNEDSTNMAKFGCEAYIDYLKKQIAIYKLGEWECEVLFGGSLEPEIVKIKQGESNELNEGDEFIFYYVASADELYELQNPNAMADFTLLSIQTN